MRDSLRLMDSIQIEKTQAVEVFEYILGYDFSLHLFELGNTKLNSPLQIHHLDKLEQSPATRCFRLSFMLMQTLLQHLPQRLVGYRFQESIGNRHLSQEHSLLEQDRANVVNGRPVELFSQHQGELCVVRQQQLLDGAAHVIQRQVDGSREERKPLLEFLLGLCVREFRQRLVERA